jgi:hypothetical protein
MPITRREAAVITAFTGIHMAASFGDVQALGDEVMGRPTWTHEYGGEKFTADLKEGVREEFLAICGVPKDDGGPLPKRVT